MRAKKEGGKRRKKIEKEGGGKRIRCKKEEWQK